jgi:hypothetical protein
MLSLIILSQAAFSQFKTGVYAGLDDYPGLLLEYRFSEKHAVQLASSYRFFDEDILLADAYKTERYLDFYIGIIGKRYLSTKKVNRDRFVGLYARLAWHQSKHLDNQSITEMQQSFFSSNYIPYSRVIYKATVGVMHGHHFYFGKNFYWGLRYGIGFSPGLYKTVEEAYYNPKRTFSNANNEILGNLVMFDIPIHISLGYRFRR